MNEPDRRSNFVTVVAWVFIVLSGLATAISLLQNVMLLTLFHGRDFAHMGQAAPPGMGGMPGFMVSHVQWMFLGFFVVSVLTLASSIGLLRREPWARWCFIGVMGLGIAWNLVGVVAQIGAIGAMGEHLHGPVVPGAPDVRAFFMLMTTLGIVVAVGMSAVFGWIAWRLLSPALAAEFAR